MIEPSCLPHFDKRKTIRIWLLGLVFVSWTRGKTIRCITDTFDVLIGGTQLVASYFWAVSPLSINDKTKRPKSRCLPHLDKLDKGETSGFCSCGLAVVFGQWEDDMMDWIHFDVVIGGAFLVASIWAVFPLSKNKSWIKQPKSCCLPHLDEGKTLGCCLFGLVLVFGQGEDNGDGLDILLTLLLNVNF